MFGLDSKLFLVCGEIVAILESLAHQESFLWSLEKVATDQGPPARLL